MACTLVLMLAISTSSSSVHRRIESSSCTRLAGGGRVEHAGADDVLAEILALVHRQRRQRLILLLRRVPRAFGRVHTLAPIEHPVGQRRAAQGLAGIDVVLDPLRHLLPAGLLPQLEGALLDAEAPAHGEVDVARAVGHAAQVHGRVVEAVAVQRPQELGLRVARFAQQLQPLGGGLLQHALDDGIGLAARRHVSAAGGVEALDLLAHLLVEAGAALLAQRAGRPAASSAPPAWRSWRRTGRSRPTACPAAS